MPRMDFDLAKVRFRMLLPAGQPRRRRIQRKILGTDDPAALPRPKGICPLEPEVCRCSGQAGRTQTTTADQSDIEERRSNRPLSATEISPQPTIGSPLGRHPAQRHPSPPPARLQSLNDDGASNMASGHRARHRLLLGRQRLSCMVHKVRIESIRAMELGQKAFTTNQLQ